MKTVQSKTDAEGARSTPRGGYGAGFALRLKAELERAGVSQVALAEKSGISPMAINHFVSGRRAPSTENLAKLLAAMWWVDARSLLCGERHNEKAHRPDSVTRAPETK